jgi:hypothetical protein
VKGLLIAASMAGDRQFPFQLIPSKTKTRRLRNAVSDEHSVRQIFISTGLCMIVCFIISRLVVASLLSMTLEEPEPGFAPTSPAFGKCLYQ